MPGWSDLSQANITGGRKGNHSGSKISKIQEVGDLGNRNFFAY